MDNQDVIMDEPVEILESSHQFPCPSCGGKMVFSPESQGLKCEYCESELNLESEDNTIIEYPLKDAEALADHNWGEEKVVVRCDQCGGETVVDSTYKATHCVFCNSSHVFAQSEDVGIKPESVLPFFITDTDAQKRFKIWINKRFYAPRKLKKQLNVEGLKGVYIPFFTYDSDTHTAFTAKRGDYYYTTRTRTVNGKTVTERVRHTRWRTVQGVYEEFYDDVLVNSSKKVNDKLVSKIGGFDNLALKAYRPEYLAGYMAERYSISLGDGWDKGRIHVDNMIESGIRGQVGGDEFRLVNKSTNYGEVKFKHLLLPLYMASFEYREKIYQFIVQGSTGKVASEYPKSILKIMGTVLLVLMICLSIYYFAYYDKSVSI